MFLLLNIATIRQPYRGSSRILSNGVGHVSIVQYHISVRRARKMSVIQGTWQADPCINYRQMLKKRSLLTANTQKNHSITQTAEDIFCRLPVTSCSALAFRKIGKCLRICLTPFHGNQQLKASKCQHCFSCIAKCLLVVNKVFLLLLIHTLFLTAYVSKF